MSGEETAPSSKRLGATEVARKLLERRAGDKVSVELARSARGVVTIAVDVELSSDVGAEAIELASKAAELEFDRLAAKYPFFDPSAKVA